MSVDLSKITNRSGVADLKERRALAVRVLSGLGLLKPENSDPIAVSPGFDLPFNNFLDNNVA